MDSTWQSNCGYNYTSSILSSNARAPVAQLVRTSVWQSEDPGSNPIAESHLCFFSQQTTWNNSCACYHAPTRHHHTALSKVLENTTTHTYYYHISPPVGPFLLQGESMGNESPAGNLGCRWGYTDRTRPHSSTYGPRDHCVCVHTKEVSMCVCAFRIVTWERLCMCVTMRMR